MIAGKGFPSAARYNLYGTKAWVAENLRDSLWICEIDVICGLPLIFGF